MEITLDRKSKNEGLIKIRLTEQDYQPQVEKTVKDYARRASIKGFRQGKVPSGVIRKMFGKSILVEEVSHLVSNRITDYIRENNLKILGEPIPNQEKAVSIDWDAQKDFEFEYHIGMVEDFTYDLSSKVKVKGYEIRVDDKVVNETIEDLKKRFGNVSYPDASEAGDTLFGGLYQEDGTLKKEHAVINLGKATKNAQKKFIGVKKGDEVTFDIKELYSDDALLAELLGESEDNAVQAAGSWTFKVENITRTTPAEMGQELYDRVFGKDIVSDEPGFVAKVRDTITENYKRETDHFLEHSIEDKLLENTTINLPDEFLKSWLKASSKGEITDEVLDKEYEHYARGLKWDLIKGKIASDNNVTVAEEEVIARAKELFASQFGPGFIEQFKEQADNIVANYLANDNGKNYSRLHDQLRNSKIMEHIRANITVENKAVSLDEFKKIVAEHKH